MFFLENLFCFGLAVLPVRRKIPPVYTHFQLVGVISRKDLKFTGDSDYVM